MDAGQPPPGVFGTRVIMAVCCVVVALSSLFNLILMFFSWGLLEKAFGGYFADNSPGILTLLTMAIQTGLFAVLCAPFCLLTRRRSVVVRNLVVVALTVLYIGFWLGWTIWLAAEMTRTNSWP
jgi:hypothetical protein